MSGEGVKQLTETTFPPTVELDIHENKGPDIQQNKRLTQLWSMENSVNHCS